MKKDWIVFDWNGTLLDDLERGYETIVELCANYGISSISLEMYRDSFGFPISEFYQKIGFKLSTEEFAKISEEYMYLYHKDPLPKPFSNAEEILIGLKEKGYKLAIVSAYKEDRLLKMLENFKLLPYFHCIYGLNNDFAHSKSDRLLELVFDHPHQKFLMVGDTLHDLEVVQSCQLKLKSEKNIDCDLIAAGHQSRLNLEKAHPKNKVFASLQEWYSSFVGK